MFGKSLFRDGLLFYVGFFNVGTGKRQLLRRSGGIDQGVESILGIPSRFLRFSLDFTFHFLALLILPLYVPVLILGAGAVDVASAGLAATGQLLVLAALLIVAAVFAPWATAVGLRVSLE